MPGTLDSEFGTRGAVRASYYSAVNRQTQTPTLFDASEQGGFNLDAPPNPWIDVGRIQRIHAQGNEQVERTDDGDSRSRAGAGAFDGRGAGGVRLSELDQADDGAGNGIAAHELAGRD